MTQGEEVSRRETGRPAPPAPHLGRQTLAEQRRHGVSGDPAEPHHPTLCALELSKSTWKLALTPAALGVPAFATNLHAIWPSWPRSRAPSVTSAL